MRSSWPLLSLTVHVRRRPRAIGQLQGSADEAVRPLTSLLTIAPVVPYLSVGGVRLPADCRCVQASLFLKSSVRSERDISTECITVVGPALVCPLEHKAASAGISTARIDDWISHLAR